MKKELIELLTKKESKNTWRNPFRRQVTMRDGSTMDARDYVRMVMTAREPFTSESQMVK
jgi:hypothetical protein